MILRLTIDDPIPGVMYSLQDKDNQPVGIVRATDAPLSFEVPITLKAGKFGGTFVRREGPLRRFVYIAIWGGQTFDGLVLSRRAKIDIHDIPADLVDDAATLACHLPGRDKHGDPACATVRTKGGWQRV